jgi:hypothetical protein
LNPSGHGASTQAERLASRDGGGEQQVLAVDFDDELQVWAKKIDLHLAAIIKWDGQCGVE